MLIYIIAYLGLRHGSFMAFLMLHFIGHNNVQVPTGVLAWAVQTVSTAHGQPTQNVALAALVRITYILCKQINPTLVTFPECPGSQATLSPTSLDTVNFLRNAFISLPMNNSNIVALLNGISQSHPKGRYIYIYIYVFICISIFISTCICI
jgi:hypothetical protein